jgi:hypothetical protein
MSTLIFKNGEGEGSKASGELTPEDIELLKDIMGGEENKD